MMFGDTAYLESLYNNRAAIPNFQDYVDRWTNNSSGICGSLKDQCERDLPYGDDLLETMDVYTPSGPPTAMLMFVHGGYWRSLDKSQHAFVARPFVDRGVAVAVINYSLCPQISMQKLVLQVMSAGAYLYRNANDFKVPKKRLFVAGHSAGGHLAAMALSCEWPNFSKGLPKKIFQSGFSISGLYDLRILTKISSINKDLRMSDTDAAMLSPALMPNPQGARLSIAVGGKELGGFKDQHRLIAQSWSSSIGLDVPCPMDNHFSILETFADPNSELFGAAMQMFE
jgi:arylformamidase